MKTTIVFLVTVFCACALITGSRAAALPGYAVTGSRESEELEDASHLVHMLKKVIDTIRENVNHHHPEHPSLNNNNNDDDDDNHGGDDGNSNSNSNENADAAGEGSQEEEVFSRRRRMLNRMPYKVGESHSRRYRQRPRVYVPRRRPYGGNRSRNNVSPY